MTNFAAEKISVFFYQAFYFWNSTTNYGVPMYSEKNLSPFFHVCKRQRCPQILVFPRHKILSPFFSVCNSEWCSQILVSPRQKNYKLASLFRSPQILVRISFYPVKRKLPDTEMLRSVNGVLHPAGPSHYWQSAGFLPCCYAPATSPCK